MERVDFVSVGSNDLFQFLFAVDRGNNRVSNRFDVLSPACLRALKKVADAGHRHGKTVTLCGELASKTLGALVLVGLGYRSLSLSPASVGPVKAMIRDLHLSRLETLLHPLLAKATTGAEIRKGLGEFVDKYGITL